MKTPKQLHDEFETKGFLGKGITQGTEDLRAENKSWFLLAEDLHSLLVRTAIAAMNSVKTNNWDQKAVAVRLLMRAAGGARRSDFDDRAGYGRRGPNLGARPY